jgi:DNA primase
MDPKEQIKERIDIHSLVSQYVDLKRAGRNYKGLSPFSNEKTPSFIVSPEKNIWHDFSSGKGGDIFSFIMEVEALTFPEALKLLAAKAGVQLEPLNPQDKDRAKLKSTLGQINQLTTKYYQACLLKNPTALNYLKERGFTKQTIKDFKLGYAPDSPQSLSNFLQKRGFQPKDLELAGVARVKNSKTYDSFRSRLMIPFISLDDQFIGFTGRHIKPGGFGPKYLNTPQTALYDKSSFLFGLNLAKDSIRKNGFAILLEGNMDVMISNQHGVKEVLAASGTAITAQQLKMIQRFTDSLILSLDSDSAGINATIRVLELATKTTLRLSVASIPKPYKDPDELIQKEGAEAWVIALQQAQDAYLWLIEALAKDVDLSSPAQKGAYAKQVLSIINQITNPVSKEACQKVLATKLDTSIDSLAGLAATTTTNQNRTLKPVQAPIKSNLSLTIKLINHFLGALINLPDLDPTLTKLNKHLTDLKLPESPQKDLLEYLTTHQKLPTKRSHFSDLVARLNLDYEALKEQSEYSPKKLLNEQYQILQKNLTDIQVQALSTQAGQDSSILVKIQQLRTTKLHKL